MKIGLFGGTFNPVTKGHVKTARYAVANLNLDSLFYVPTNKTPFKNSDQLASNNDRVKMLEKVLTPKTKVCEFEVKRRGVSYSVDTVKYFKRLFPDDDLFLIVGSDHIPKLNKWKNINQIASLSQIVVFKRALKVKHANLKKYRCLLLDNPLFGYSSTSFKLGQTRNVTPEVLAYIASKHLYLGSILKANVSDKRYVHCLNTASLAAKLAKRNNQNPEDAYVAGLMHDLTKNWSLPKQRAYLKTKKVSCQDTKDFALHAQTARVFLEQDYKLKNKNIISAIAKHTTLSPQMNLFEKIIFASDKLCKGRKRPGIQKERELIFRDFNKGFSLLLKNLLKELKTRTNVDQKTLNVYEELMSP